MVKFQNRYTFLLTSCYFFFNVYFLLWRLKLTVSQMQGKHWAKNYSQTLRNQDTGTYREETVLYGSSGATTCIHTSLMWQLPHLFPFLFNSICGKIFLLGHVPLSSSFWVQRFYNHSKLSSVLSALLTWAFQIILILLVLYFCAFNRFPPV